MCCRVSKFNLVIINIVYLLTGATCVGVSIWVIGSDNYVFKLDALATQGSSNIDNETLIKYKSATSNLVAAAWVTLGLGALAFILGFCGFLGAITENRDLVFCCAEFIGTIGLFTSVAGGTVYTIIRGVTTQSSEEPSLSLKRLEATHYLPINLAVSNDSAPNAVFSSLVNYAQVSLECCGVFNMTDITGENTLWSNSSRVYKNGTLVVPVTCCRTKNRDELLSHQNWSRIDDYLMDPNCPYNSNSTEINTEGCYDKMTSYDIKFSVALFVVKVLLVVVGIFETCLVVRWKLFLKDRQDNRIFEAHQPIYRRI